MGKFSKVPPRQTDPRGVSAQCLTNNIYIAIIGHEATQYREADFKFALFN